MMPLTLRLVCVIIVVVLVCSAESFRLTILHTNDMHSRFEEVSKTTGPCTGRAPCFGGFSRLAAEAKRLKDMDPNHTIFLNAGDTFQGTPYYHVFKWNIVADLIDRLGIDVMSLGNHEFDDGVRGLDPYLRAVKTPTVTANLDLSRVPTLSEGNLHPFVNLFVDGVNVSVIGYLTPDTKFLSVPGEVRFTDEIEVIKRLAADAKRGGAKLVIALGHSGFAKDKEIAAQIADVDVVVGGHTDTFLYTGTPPEDSVEPVEGEYPFMVTQKGGKKVPVVQAYGYTKYLGKLELEFDSNYKLTKASGNPILLDSSKPQDDEVLSAVMTWKAKMSVELDKVVGRTIVDLDGLCRNNECNLGNFFNDAMIDYRAREMELNLDNKGWTDTPIAMINGGAIRTSLNLNDTGGKIKEADILTVMPFDNRMIRSKLSGTQLKEVLEMSVSSYDPIEKKGKGGFLQLSGIRVKYDLSKPPGQRVASALVRCGLCTQPRYDSLNLTDTYYVLMSEFLAHGGDGYTMLKEMPAEDQEILNWSEIDAFRSYATKSTPMYPGVEGRIEFVKSPEVSGNSKSSGHMERNRTPFIFLLTTFLTLLRKGL